MVEKEIGLEGILLNFEDPKSGEQKKIPALDLKWIIEIDFLPFWEYPPSSRPDDQELWFRSVSALSEDITTILKLPLHRYWSQVLFDCKLQTLIDSFLKIGPRTIRDSPQVLSSEVFQKFLELMFKLFLRMGTNKEAQYTKNKTYPDLSAVAFADIVYDNYLFDLPKILELCKLYRANRGLLSEMMEGLFRKQYKYFYDIQEMIRCTLLLLQKVADELGYDFKIEGEENGPVRLEEKRSKSLSLDKFLEIIRYVEDVFCTLECFLSTCGSASQCFTPSFVNHLVNFYEMYVPAVVHTWLLQRGKLGDQGEFVKCSLRRTKLKFCKTLSYILENNFFEKFSETSINLESIQTIAEDFLTICNCLIGTKYLVREYQQYFDLQTKFLMLKNFGVIDEIQFEYLTAPLSSDSDVAKATEPEVNTEPDQLVSSVQAILPHVHVSTIREVLQLHNLNVSHAINTLCERMPTVQIEEDPTPPPKGASCPELDLVSQRKNIFTGDEFDVYTRDDIDSSRVFTGKKDKFGDGEAFLNRRENTEKTRQLASLELQYDDEYDDTYDDVSFDVGGEVQGEEFVEKLNEKGMYSNRYSRAPALPEELSLGDVEAVEPGMFHIANKNWKQDNRG